MFSMGETSTKNVIVGFVAVLVGVILIAPLNDAVVAAGFTGTLGTVVGLIPVLFGLGVLYASVKGLLG